MDSTQMTLLLLRKRYSQRNLRSQHFTIWYNGALNGIVADNATKTPASCKVYRVLAWLSLLEQLYGRYETGGKQLPSHHSINEFTEVVWQRTGSTFLSNE